jgi:hypothetical protein
VFENGLGTATSLFAELGYVEVSTDGVHFARFDSISRTPAPTSPQSHLYLPVDPTGIHNLAGKHANGNGHDLGTPFDLAELAEHELVRQGLLSVNRIEYVRIVDVVGSGDFLDSRGEPIYDAWPTWGSGGFDLEAIGALHAAELGDWNRDGTIDATDLDALGVAFQAGSTDLVFDYNSDGSVDREDLRAILADRFGAGPADANLDGVVDPADLQLLRDHFGRAGGWSDGDVSLDGQVDFADYVLLARHWGDQAPLPPLSVPEPSALAALLTAGLVAAGRRRRR